MKGAYKASPNPADLSDGLNVIADALNRDDLGRAMVAALHLRLPDLDRVGAAGVALADDLLAKYPGQPRDWHGRFADGKETPRPSVSGRRQNRFAAHPEPRSVFSSPAFQTARRLAAVEEVVGGGPEDPFADAAAFATLMAGLAIAEARQGRHHQAANDDDERASAPGLPSSRPSYDKECEDFLRNDMINCQIVKATRGKEKAKVCRSVANDRYAECLRWGPANVRTPFYWGN